jgi:hypothetical protein
MERRMTRRIFRARPGDLVEAVAIVAVALRIEVSLRRHGLPDTATRFGLQLASRRAVAERGAQRTPLPQWAIRRARLAQLVLRVWPFGDTCLRKSLVIGNRLASLHPQLFIGVRTSDNDGSVLAHAWLEICGIDIDPTSGDYLEFEFT